VLQHNIMIQAEQTITIPAVPQKTFGEQWVFNLVVQAPTPTSGSVSIELLPYNSQTGEIGPLDLSKSISTDKLWEAIQEVPEMATAFNAVIAAVPPMKAWIESKRQEEIINQQNQINEQFSQQNNIVN
jgi:hypothetical protein